MPKRRFKRFVSDTVNYEFPVEQQSLNSNYTNTTPRASKFPGMSGAFDEYQGNPSPSETGNVALTWKLLSPTYAGLGALKDAANAMAGSGAGFLLTIPQGQQDERRGLRWATVKPNNVPIPENSDQGIRSLDASANFQVYDPCWYGCNPTPQITSSSDPLFQQSYNRLGWVHFDDGLNWDTSGLVWGGPRVTKFVFSLTEPGTDSVNCTNHGNAKTYPVLRLTFNGYDPEGPSGDGAWKLGFRRRSRSGVILEGFEWNYLPQQDEVLVVDCKAQTVTLSTTSGDIDVFEYFEVITGIGFIEFEGGVNTLEMYGTHGGFSLEIDYADAWY